MQVELKLERDNGIWYYSAIVNNELLVGSKALLTEVFDVLLEAVTIDI